MGAVQVYVDGVQVGAMNEGVPTDGLSSPGLHDVMYVARGDGCPDGASLTG